MQGMTTSDLENDVTPLCLDDGKTDTTSVTVCENQSYHQL